MNDEGRRGHSAVAHSITETPSGDLYVFQDQLTQVESSGLGHRIWHHQVFTTNFRITKQDLDAMSFSEDQLKGLGLMVMSALRTHYAERFGFRPPWERR
jgi:hypothetical protein